MLKGNADKIPGVHISSNQNYIKNAQYIICFVISYSCTNSMTNRLMLIKMRKITWTAE